MQFLIWFREWLGNDESSRSWERHVIQEGPAGDSRAPYGFGRRAHRPDPDAKYSFGDDPTHRMHHATSGRELR
jgi:hypothetical protein